MSLFDLPEGSTKVRVPGVDVNIGEKFGELFGYCRGFRICLAGAIAVGERDRLVRGDLDSFS